MRTITCETGLRLNFATGPRDYDSDAIDMIDAMYSLDRQAVYSIITHVATMSWADSTTVELMWRRVQELDYLASLTTGPR